MKENRTLRKILDWAIKALRYQMTFTGNITGSLEPDENGDAEYYCVEKNGAWGLTNINK